MHKFLLISCLVVLALAGPIVLGSDTAEFWGGINKDGNWQNSNARSISGNLRVRWSTALTGLVPFTYTMLTPYNSQRSNNLAIRNGRILLIVPPPPNAPPFDAITNPPHATFGMYSLATGSLLQSTYSPHACAGSVWCNFAGGAVMDCDQMSGLVNHYWDANGAVLSINGSDHATSAYFDPYTAEAPIGQTITIPGGPNYSGSFAMSNSNPNIYACGGYNGHGAFDAGAIVGLINGGTAGINAMKCYASFVLDGNWVYPLTMTNYTNGFGSSSGYGVQITGVQVTASPFSATTQWIYTDASKCFLGFGMNQGGGAPRAYCLGQDGRLYYYGYNVTGTGSANWSQGMLLVGVQTAGPNAGTSDLTINVAYNPTSENAAGENLVTALQPQIAALGSYVVVFQPPQSNVQYGGNSIVNNGHLFCFNTVSKTLAWQKDFAPGYFYTHVDAEFDAPAGSGATDRAVQMTVAGDSAYIVEPYVSSGNLTVRVQKFVLATGAQTTSVFPVRNSGQPVTVANAATVASRDVAAVDSTLTCLIDYDLLYQALVVLEGDQNPTYNFPPVAVMSAPVTGTPLGGDLTASTIPSNQFDSNFTIQFSSQGSYSPQGRSLTYSWNFGDGAISTSANPVHVYASVGAAGQITNYTVTLTVTDSAGNVSAPVSRPLAINSIGNAQEYVFNAIADALVASNQPNINYGSLSTLQVGSGDPTYGNTQSYIQFDLASMNLSSVVAATLRLRCVPGFWMQGTELALCGTSNAWTETGITWNTAPAAGAVVGTNNCTSGLDQGGNRFNTTADIPVDINYIKANGGELISFALVESPVVYSWFLACTRESGYPAQLILQFASGAPTTYTIAASAGTGGTINPSGTVTVNSGASQTFAIAANSGYIIAGVTVDGSAVGAVSSYTFNNVTANHTIAATFNAVPVTYTITASAGTGGTITPSGAVTVNSGASQTFTIAANSGYTISGVTVDGSSVGAVSSYTFNNVTANHTITAAFNVVPVTYTITASAGTGGTITPSGTVTVTSGGSQTFAIAANSGYAIASVTVDGASAGAVSSYTFSNVTANHTIAAAFAVNLTASAIYVTTDTTTEGNWVGVYGSDGYSIQSGSTNYPAYATVSVANNATYLWAGSTSDVRAPWTSTAKTARIAACWFQYPGFTFDVNLTDGQPHQVAIYCLDWDSAGRTENVEIDDAGTGAVLDGPRSMSAFTNGKYLVWTIKGHVKIKVTDITGANAVISGIFFGGGTTPTTYTITASAGTGGTLTPSGAVTVNSGANQTFTIAANNGYTIGSVTVDGSSVGPVSSYTFNNVAANHTIAAAFNAAPVTYTITASAGTGGTITPSGAVTVNSGSSQTFAIAANSGYTISGVTVDGSSVGAVATYTFNNVTANHTIAAAFNSSTGPAGSNMGFEIPNVGPAGQWTSFQYNPAGAVWTFVGNSGITANGSGFTGSYAGQINAPEGVQAAFLQMTGSFSQSISGFQAGVSYAFVFSAAQRMGNAQDFQVFLDSTSLGTFKPGSAYADFTTAAATPGAGSHTLKFVGLDSAGGDNTAFIDNVRINAGGSVTTYTITASAGTGGTITPSGTVTVNSGANQTFTIAANSGYTIGSVTVDGSSVGSVSSYTFNNVAANHTIAAAFNVVPVTYTITASAGTGGTITPSGTLTVNSGGSQTFAITANSGYTISGVTVDGTSVGAVSSYAFNNVTSNHTITAAFVASSGPVGSNMGFETPSVGPVGQWTSFQYNPTGAAWTFVGNSGIAANGCGFTGSYAGQLNAPEGIQVAFLQMTGSFSQVISGFQAGVSYTVTFSAAQRPGVNGPNAQNVQVFLDNTSLGTFTPGAAYADITTAAVTPGAGSHTLKFVGLDSAGGDNTAFVDNVRIQDPPSKAGQVTSMLPLTTVAAVPGASTIDLGSVKEGKKFKLRLPLPANIPQKTASHTTASGLPQGVRVSGDFIGGKAKTTGTYTITVQFTAKVVSVGANGKRTAATVKVAQQYTLTVTQ